MTTTVVAEGGLNHNGSLDTAKRLIDAAIFAGADIIKWQKGSPETCVPRAVWDTPRETPWGTMRYIDYKHRMEFGRDEYDALDEYCRERGIQWTASVWDIPSVDFLLPRYDLPWLKIPSAKLTDLALIEAAAGITPHIVLSTGMSTLDEVDRAMDCLHSFREHGGRVTLMHCHSAYPAPSEELNLRVIHTLKDRYRCPVGYSGHEYGIEPTVWAVAMGAVMVERHITLDRTSWGTDHESSVEPLPFQRMVRHIRGAEKARGDGEKIVWASEEPARAKLRGTQLEEAA